jgi:ATP-dependent exoDNAse (exonuclease V) alpha subunit
MTQKEALDILKLGHNVFLTGPAGSGKTYLLNQYIAYLKSHRIPVGITASTGIAATHMGGTTIHSWSGMGIRDSMTPQDMGELFKRQYLRTRFLHTKVLIIDEISMLHSHQLDLVNTILKTFKRNDLPFGGLQVILCGDFFQLPPVSKKDETANFVTKSDAWAEMNIQICYLDEQFRQDDRSFLRVLNDIRNNEVSEMTVEYLSERLNKEINGYAKATRLFTHNADVDAINKAHLEALPGETKEYFMNWRGSLGLTDILKKSCLAPEKLFLKRGAQVMFVKNNYDEGFVNGTLGVVIGFAKNDVGEDSPIVRTFDGAEIVVKQASWEVKEEEIEKAAISQLPLRLAWAITIHKSQGMTLDAAEVDLSRSFVPGQGYVALSRIRSLSGLKLMGLNQMALQVNPDVSEIDREFIQQSFDAGVRVKNMDVEKRINMQEGFLLYLQGK